MAAELQTTEKKNSFGSFLQKSTSFLIRLHLPAGSARITPVRHFSARKHSSPMRIDPLSHVGNAATRYPD